MSFKINTLLFSCLLVALFVIAPAMSSPRLMTLKFPCDDYAVAAVVATDPAYGALGDGKTDCTASIQAAIDAAGVAGGGVVFLPAGRYVVGGGLTLRVGVTLRGDWKAPNLAASDLGVDGTVLMATGRRGQPDGLPLITMYCGACVRNLSVWYPEQNAADVAPYPWTISSDCSMGQDCFTVENVTLVNSYQGIRFGLTATELEMVRNVYGTPLKTGISMDKTSDTGRIARVRFGSQYWSGSGLGAKPDDAALRNQLITKATAIELLRTDGQCLYDVSIDGYQIGIHFGRSALGNSYGPAYGLAISGCDTGLLIDDALGMTGWQFANSSIDALWSAVSIGRNFQSTVQFNGCRLSAMGDYAVRSDGGGLIQMQNCVLTGSLMLKNQGSLNMLACRLERADSHIVLGPLVTRALVVGGIPASAVESHGGGDIQVDPAPLVSETLENAPPLSLPPDRKPAKSLMFNVANYGAMAQPEADNTSAFQKALDDARKAGGGTVYVPAGEYRFAGSLTVPSGVEIRGSFDAPHHTMSEGTVLMPMFGRGRETGDAFISLSSGSGVRGLTVYYPDQRVDDIVAYPWTIRALGPGCWLLDVTGSNVYQFVDFGTNPSDGHLIRDVDGGPLKAGIWVSKGSGEVDNCQFNDHFWMRRYKNAPPLASPNADPKMLGKQLWKFLAKNLEGLVFGDCQGTLQVDNVVIPDAHGLRFVSDSDGASSGWVIGHQSDLSVVGLRVDAAGAGGLRFVDTQLVHVAPDGPAKALEVGPDCSQDTIFYNGLTWGTSDDQVVDLFGRGHTTLQCWSLQQGGVHAGGRDMSLQAVMCRPASPCDVTIGPSVKHLKLDACSTTGDKFAFGENHGVTVRDVSGPCTPVPLTDRFATSFDAGQGDLRSAVTSTSFKPGESTCGVVAGVGRSGGPAVVFDAKLPVGVDHSFELVRLFDVGALIVKPDTIFRYWVKPSTTISRYACVDLVFTDGTTLRDSHAADMTGGSVHPATARGMLGQWTMVQIMLGAVETGKSIRQIVLIYDNYHGDCGKATVAVGGIEIGEPRSAE